MVYEPHICMFILSHITLPRRRKHTHQTMKNTLSHMDLCMSSVPDGEIKTRPLYLRLEVDFGMQRPWATASSVNNSMLPL